MQLPVFQSDDEFDTWMDDYCFVRQLRTADFVQRLMGGLQGSGFDIHSKPPYKLLPEIVNSGVFQLPE